jgi:hypothetical protein
MGKLAIVKEFLSFLRVRKRYWLIPVVLLMLLIGMLIVVTEGSAIAPFIYALF